MHINIDNKFVVVRVLLLDLHKSKSRPMLFSFIIWNARPQLIDFGNFEIRYYSLLFALGFVAGYLILARIFKKKGLNPDIIDKLTVYMVLSTIIGARLGHCLFYEFDYYIKNPLEIFLPWQGMPGSENFKFTGFQGLASHGAAIGILLGIWLFSKKTKLSYLWTMDMIVIVTALAGSMIRTGNLMNSEIYGRPTNSTYGFVYARDLTNIIERQFDNNIDNIRYKTIKDAPAEGSFYPVEMNIRFKRNTEEQYVQSFATGVIPEFLSRYDFDNNVKAAADTAVYSVERNIKGPLLKYRILGNPRHPSQIYEALSYLLIFFILLFIWYRYGERVKPGFIFGMFLLLVFMARFFIEFIKENQEAFESQMALNMGQVLSIPFVLAGLALIFLRRPEKIS